MAVPRNRHSKARTNSKRAHHAKKPRQFSRCQNCASSTLPHHVCQACGFYGKTAVLEVKTA